MPAKVIAISSWGNLGIIGVTKKGDVVEFDLSDK